MIGFGGDNLYELELYVPDPSLVTLPDQGGMDTISALYAHDELVEINLSFGLDSSGAASCAMAHYFGGKFQIWHQLIIYGVVEHAIGSPGSDKITGNELDNHLSGEVDLAGPGAADTINGGRGDDTLMGGGGADVLSGGEDNDLLQGGAGADLILGGTGNDTVTGGAGADTLDGGGDAGDLLSYAGSALQVSLNLRVDGFALATGGDAEGDLVQGFRNILGSAFSDLLVDDDKADLGNGANANRFYGANGRDRLELGGGSDTGWGGPGFDTLLGENGNDMLYGGPGQDRVIGGAGADVLWGGDGADQFQFLRASDCGAPGFPTDRIADFSALEGDRIDLSPIDANRLATGNQAFLRIEGSFTGQAGQLRLVVQGSDLQILADLNGDLQADLAILVRGVATLTASDILL